MPKEAKITEESARKNILLMIQAVVIHGCNEDDLEFIKEEVKRFGITIEEILDVIAETHKGLADGSLKIIGVDDCLNAEIQEVFSALRGTLWPPFEKMDEPGVFVLKDNLPKIVSLADIRKARAKK